MTRKTTTNRPPRRPWKKAAALAAIGLTTAAASATNLTTNPGFLDIDEDLAFGDSWGTFGAIAFLDFFNDNNPGHATLFADQLTNIGFLFQTGIPAIPGETYEVGASVSFETNWDATTSFGIEFYAADDATKVGETITQISGPLGEGYRRYRLQATAPASAVFVRPIIFFDSVQSAGASRAATVDNMTLSIATENLIENPGFEDIIGDGEFGDLWGTFDNVGFGDFFGNGNPGHAIFFGDFFFNFGTLFQLGIPGTPGTEYRLAADISFEDQWDALTDFGLEFYDTDDTTKLGETIVPINQTIGGGYLTYEMTATAPAGTAFVRPVFFFDFVASEGEQRAATIDNVVLEPNTTNGPCSPADVTTDGTANGIPDQAVTLSDFSFYLGLWGAGDTAADLTTDGTSNGVPDGAVTLSDFSFYLALWGAGCP